MVGTETLNLFQWSGWKSLANQVAVCCSCHRQWKCRFCLIAWCHNLTIVNRIDPNSVDKIQKELLKNMESSKV